ncbi:MAG: HD domain-containing protein [Proteobacteria bacterium]|nr:HD domain-containing protein [Pseudomonadota bacterium]MBU1709592.1 HD domain-containing protein [Pseudomonadota bacterium]
MTERLMKISEEYCDGKGGCHGPDHTERVHRVALFIGRKMGARMDVLSAAALLHDIGRIHETANRGKTCHAEKGAEMATKILEDFNFPEETIDAILHCITTHRYRGENIPESLEAKIIFDADKLDSIGAIGIGRAFLFAGQVGARLHNHNSSIEGTRAYSVEDTAYREFKVKMCKIKDRMLTPIGRKLATERHEFMDIFFNRLEREIYGHDKKTLSNK